VNLLVVEDDELVANLVRMIFERHGHKVTQIADGGEARRTISEQDPPDIVLLDYMLPGMSGLDLIKEIRKSKAWKDVPVIFLSGRASGADVEDAMKAGATDYVTKPFGIHDLTDRVNKLVEG
jgi:two-component system phosphate regulon response regulator PhoB